MLKANLQSISQTAIPTAYRTSACAGQIFARKINFKSFAAVPILSSTPTLPKPSGSSNSNGYSLVLSSSSSDWPSRFAGLSPRSVKSSWIIVSNTAVYIMSCSYFFRDNYWIPCNFKSIYFFVVFATSFFRDLRAVYFVTNFWFELSEIGRAHVWTQSPC